MNSPRNLAASAGRWSAQHRKTAIIGWILFIVVATFAGKSLAMKDLPDAEMANGESKRSMQIMESADFPETVGEQVLIQGKGSIKSDDPEVTAAVKDTVQRLERIDGVTDIHSPLNKADRHDTVSKDGRSVVVNFTPARRRRGRGEADRVGQGPARRGRRGPEGSSRAARRGVRRRLRAPRPLRHREAADEAKSMQFSFGGTLIILLLAFGAMVAAGVPLFLGLTSVFATIGLLGPVSQISGLHPAVAQVVMLVGLAVGVDYAMFYMRRMMEEKDKGRSAADALDVAAATSGRAVLISGLTVMAAMGGMFFSGNPIFVSFGIGTIIVVGVAILGSLTVLPAILSYLGQKGWLEKGRLPFILKRRHRNQGESRMWGAILDRVLKRPLVSAIAAGGILVALTIPALGMTLKDPGTESMSRDEPIMQTFDRIDAAFPGGAVPAVAVIKAKDVTAPAVEAGIADLQKQALATGKLHEPTSVEISPDKTVAMVAMAIDGNGNDAASEASLEALREDVIPSTINKVAGTETAVGGMTAFSKDFLDTMKSHLPIVFLFVLSLAFILLLVTFRSIVVPIKAIILNLLSVGAAYGILKLVFQDGHGEKLLGFESVGGIASWLPLFLFVILFGLSMDYHVFVLSRVREAVDRGMSTDNAVAHGIKSTAGIITSAAAVMVITFAGFATGSDQTMKQMGVGLAAAILIDATLVRAVLLPATMKLLGKRNWYLPKGLHWLPKFEHEPQVAPAGA